jgi:hypothetical protein
MGAKDLYAGTIEKCAAIINDALEIVQYPERLPKDSQKRKDMAITFQSSIESLEGTLEFIKGIVVGKLSP